MEVTIAVNGYRTPDLLRLCLKSVEEALAGSGIAYEVLVTDSATEEDTEMLMREEFPHVRFFPFRENVGFKTMVNTSVEQARGEYLFLVNSDIVLTKEAVPGLLSYIRQHPEIGILSPRQLNFDGTLQHSYFHFYRPWTILYRRTWLAKFSFARKHLEWFTMKNVPADKPMPVDWVLGSAMFLSRAHAKKVGPMDTRFFLYMEDVDWCRRFWEQGLQVVYFPGVFVYHYHAKGSARGGFFGSLLFNRLTWYHIGSALKYFWKYRGKPLPRI